MTQEADVAGEESPATEPPSSGAIVVTRGTASAQPLYFPDGALVTFGRHPDNDIVLDIPQVSRRHGLIYFGPHFATVSRLVDSAELWVDCFDSDGPSLIEQGRTVAIDSGFARLQIRTVIPPRHVEATSELFGDPLITIRIIKPLHQQRRTDDRHDTRAELTAPAVSALRADPTLPILVALCARLLVDGSSHQLGLPNNQEVADWLAEVGQNTYKSSYVRKALSEWRFKLGLPQTRARHCHCSLAVAAIQTGLVTSRDVELLERGDTGASFTLG